MDILIDSTIKIYVTNYVYVLRWNYEYIRDNFEKFITELK